MIIRATLRNILSFEDEVSISFVATKSKLHKEHVKSAKKRRDISILRTGVIYGANASGKSNFIKAIEIIQKLAKGEKIQLNWSPFKSLKQSHISSISKIELEIKIGERYYAYGVEFNTLEIKEEWLYIVDKDSDIQIFEREVTSLGNEFSINYLDKNNSQNNQFLSYLGEGTPRNRTFLAEYVERNGRGLDDINIVYDWFFNNLQIVFPDSKYSGLAQVSRQDQDYHDNVRELLKHFNTGITDLRLVPSSIEESKIPLSIINNIVENSKIGSSFSLSNYYNEIYFFEIKDNGLSVFKQKTVHANDSGELIFEMKEESDGSQRLLDFIGMLIDLQKKPIVYLIDEIDRSLHPNLTYEILKIFLDFSNIDTESQLIITTHESHLLDLSLLRSDEIWFVEKDNDGASHFVSLSEYKPRNDIEKGYLKGVYSAIPFFASRKSLNWK